jgi:CelD/BcsL family acetyltransferase involved in cellulose biosynthesis
MLIQTMTREQRWQAGSPGLVTVFMALNYAVQAGWRVFDLSIGALDYKTRFGANKIDLFELQQALSLRGIPPVFLARIRSVARGWRQHHPEIGHRLRALKRRILPQTSN